MTNVLSIKVKPKAAASVLQALPDGSWSARLKAPPVYGRADGAPIKLVAGHFGLRKAQVRIKSGAQSRNKRVEIDAA